MQENHSHSTSFRIYVGETIAMLAACFLAVSSLIAMSESAFAWDVFPDLIMAGRVIQCLTLISAVTIMSFIMTGWIIKRRLWR